MKWLSSESIGFWSLFCFGWCWFVRGLSLCESALFCHFPTSIGVLVSFLDWVSRCKTLMVCLATNLVVLVCLHDQTWHRMWHQNPQQVLSLWDFFKHPAPSHFFSHSTSSASLILNARNGVNGIWSHFCYCVVWVVWGLSIWHYIIYLWCSTLYVISSSGFRGAKLPVDSLQFTFQYTWVMVCMAGNLVILIIAVFTHCALNWASFFWSGSG